MRMVYYAVKNPHWREQIRKRRERERAGGPAPDGAAGGAPPNGDGHANGHATNGDEWEPPEHV
jgi:hypothetical protein